MKNQWAVGLSMLAVCAFVAACAPKEEAPPEESAPMSNLEGALSRITPEGVVEVARQLSRLEVNESWDTLPDGRTVKLFTLTNANAAAVAEPGRNGPDADRERRDARKRKRLQVIGGDDDQSVRPQPSDLLLHRPIGAEHSVALARGRSVPARDDQARVGAGERADDLHGSGPPRRLSLPPGPRGSREPAG